MKTIAQIFFVSVLSLIATFSFAQDVLHKKGGEQLLVRVLEIGEHTISYKNFNADAGHIMNISTRRIEKIELEDGEVHYFSSNNLEEEDFYIEMPKRALKIGLFSPLAGFTDISYEQMLTPRTSLEFSGTIIGLGKQNSSRNDKGIGITGAYKGYLKPKYSMNDQYLSSLMHGWYLKGEVTFGMYNGKRISDTNTSGTTTFGGLTAVLGKQWIFGDKIALDLYLGAGYGFSNSKSDIGVNNHYILQTYESGFAAKSGIRIGYLF